MGRHQTAYCPNCGALSFRCQCGVAQPKGAYRPPAAQLPQRSFIQSMPPVMPRRGPMARPVVGFGQVAYPPAQAEIRQVMHTPVEAILQMPEVAVRVQEMINEAVTETAARYGNAPQTYEAAPSGVPVETIDALYRMPLEAIPGNPPNNNTGGRLNAYNQGRKEVFDAFTTRLRDLISNALPSEFAQPEVPAELGDGQQPGVGA